MDESAESLLMEIRSFSYRHLSCILGQPQEGLAVAARKARKAGIIDSKWCKRLVRIDDAFSVVRHLSRPKIEETKKLLKAMVCVPTESCMPGDGMKANDKKHEEDDANKTEANKNAADREKQQVQTDEDDAKQTEEDKKTDDDAGVNNMQCDPTDQNVDVHRAVGGTALSKPRASTANELDFVNKGTDAWFEDFVCPASSAPSFSSASASPPVPYDDANGDAASSVFTLSHSSSSRSVSAEATVPSSSPAVSGSPCVNSRNVKPRLHEDTEVIEDTVVIEGPAVNEVFLQLQATVEQLVAQDSKLQVAQQGLELARSRFNCYSQAQRKLAPGMREDIINQMKELSQRKADFASHYKDVQTLFAHCADDATPAMQHLRSAFRSLPSRDGDHT